MTNKNLIAVWWVNQKDCEQIDPKKITNKRIRSEFESRYGRAGRGRLWVIKEIKVQQVEVPKQVVWEDGDTHGGIVIFKEDIETVRPLGGFLSDADGNLL